MKLPGINYNTPVQSLGRYDTNDPIRLANAQNKAIDEGAKLIKDVVESIDANKIAIDASRFQAAFSEINALTKNRKSYTVDELDQLEVKYDSKYGIGKVEEVPAYQVSRDVYKKMTNELYKSSVASTSKKGGAVISKMYGQLYKEGVQPVIANSLSDAHSIRSVENEIAFNAALAAGNAEAASMIAETARATGAWGPEKYLAKTKDMPNELAKGKYLQNLNATDDLQGLNSSVDILLDDPDLSSGSKSSLFKQYSTKANKVEKENEKVVKEAKDKQSYGTFVDSATTILEDNEPMEWNEINKIAHGMNSSDGKGLITLNRLAASKGATTDPKVLNALTVQVKSLSIPRDGTTIHQRRESLVNELMTQAGFDPVTGKQIRASKISSGDFARVWDSINKSQGFAYDNPEVKNKSDLIWKTLTGGSKDIMTSLFGAGASTLNAIEAETAMLAAARDSGPGFNPDIWWDKNGDKFITSAIEDNEQTMRDDRIDKYIVRGAIQDGGIDIKGTAQALNQKVKSGIMTQAQASENMRRIKALQTQKQEMYNRGMKKKGVE